MNKIEFAKLNKEQMIIAFNQLKDDYSNLFNQLEEKEKDIRLDQTKKVFEVLADAIKNESMSYRHLIYDELGFIGYYYDLMAGLTVTNAIVDLEEKNKVIDEAIDYIKNITFSCEDEDIHLNELFDTNNLLEILERGKNGKQ